MWSYSAYGLAIQSDVRLPELMTYDTDSALESVSRSSAGIRIHMATPARSALDEATEYQSEVVGDEVVLQWRRVGTFRIRQGREIVVTPTLDAEERDVRLFLLGSVLGVALHQQGKIALHASAVVIRGGAYLFVGGSGWGKSTMCATFHARGSRVLADDVSVIDWDSRNIPMVTPAVPRLKLWPEALSALGYDAAQLPALGAHLTKRSFSIAETFPDRQFPLQGIYILSKGDTVSIEPVSAIDALLQLVVHTYCARLFRHTHSSAQFRRYTRLAAAVPVRRLVRRWSLDDLSMIAEAVERDVGQ